MWLARNLDSMEGVVVATAFLVMFVGLPVVMRVVAKRRA